MLKVKLRKLILLLRREAPQLILILISLMQRRDLSKQYISYSEIWMRLLNILICRNIIPLRGWGCWNILMWSIEITNFEMLTLKIEMNEIIILVIWNFGIWFQGSYASSRHQVTIFSLMLHSTFLWKYCKTRLWHLESNEKLNELY